MAEPPAKRLRATPRKNDADEAQENDTTPYTGLRQLASNLRDTTNTPQGPPSAYRTANRTPGTASRTPRTGIRQRQFPARVGPPTTPHAIRALQARRDADRASGSKRRRSGLQARETPRDFLRALSRIIRPTPVPSNKPTPRARPSLSDDFDEGPDPGPRPRLSMPISKDEIDDDSFHEAPPRMSLALEDIDMDGGNTTMHSVEGMRRAVSEDPTLRSRLSLGRMRLSERFGGMEELGEEADEGDMLSYADDDDGGPLIFDDPDNPLEEEITTRFGDDTTQELRAMLAARRRSRMSDLGLATRSDDLDEEPTFRFVMSQAERDPSAMPPGFGDDIDDEGAAVGEEGEEEEEEEGAPQDETVRTRFSLNEIDAEAGAEVEAEEYEDVEPQEDEEAEPSPDADLGTDAEKEEEEEEDATITRRLRGSPTPADADADTTTAPGQQQKRKRALPKLSRFGTPYPALPASTVKRVATTFARLHGGGGGKLSRETLDAVALASEWFFEQVGEDLGAYAGHAGRRTIEEADVVALMNRQRQISASTTPFSLAQKYLPRELLQEVRMPRAAPKARKKRRRGKMETIEEGEVEEVEEEEAGGDA
ncbi:uncharacterized protein K452DRAFT_324237 [Aplosporella prunicola CBS 121167]|uniref:CENP-T/Histone H4 histone fold domain-containing protein n=1 Tax=Aplosporella prunicola CBS 121167 TaxID=1176127 RepID=A0A6A6BSL6_9PEZI|nr:uncharacterized protein K452DRAFT_324237 [Aplosporella prunicola CBS 121167]KAF2146234.1 hypothetical protein K452DRAFT_324237 [Aplosporella prunicola CBS 121167]